MVEKDKNSIFGEYKISTEMKIVTYNILHGGDSNLEQALDCMKQMNVDMGIMTETKLQGFHTELYEGYQVVATWAKSRSQGGVALFYRRQSKLFHVEGTRKFGPNVIQQHWYPEGRNGGLWELIFHPVRKMGALWNTSQRRRLMDRLTYHSY